MTEPLNEPVALLPCPFCGGTDLKVWERPRHGMNVLCTSCEAAGPFTRVTGEEADEHLEAWNRRVSPAPADVAWVGENRETIARIIIGAVYDGDADDLMHAPHQKSWEEPTQRRWEQFLETADEILARVSAPTEPPPEMLAELVEACRPLAEKARRWDEVHGADRRDSVQIEHRIGDFRRIREILDRKSCAEGEGQ